MHVPLHAKVLKETEETIDFLSLVAFQLAPSPWLRLCIQGHNNVTTIRVEYAIRVVVTTTPLPFPPLCLQSWRYLCNNALMNALLNEY